MKKQKLTYLSPTTETLVVRFEGGLLTGSDQAQVSTNILNRGGGYGDGDDAFFDYDD